jgi:hypothetical protein
MKNCNKCNFPFRESSPDQAICRLCENPLPVHLSSWGEQGIGIGLCCHPDESYYPWTKLGLPIHVHEVPFYDGRDSLLYVHEDNYVTCEECKKTVIYTKQKESREEWESEVNASGLSEKEYIEKLDKEFLQRLEDHKRNKNDITNTRENNNR